MTNRDITFNRLISQQIATPLLKQPQEVVAWMGAMQAQEYAMVNWAIGLRLNGVKNKAVEDAFNKGYILRTHLLRPTWHFVSPADIRWILALTAPRVHAANAFMYRKLELSNTILHRSNDILAKALEGAKHLTRETLNQALERQNIRANGLRLGYLMMHAELEGLICSGARAGKQFTYALLDERVPAAKTRSREEALAELAMRYFASRGPATVQDFAYWSALALKDAREGAELIKNNLQQEKHEDSVYFYRDTHITAGSRVQKTFLMPDYDEYGMSYKDRSALFKPKQLSALTTGNFAYNRMLVVDGMIRGSWKRTLTKDSLLIKIQPLTPLNETDTRRITHAAKDFGVFMEKKVGLEF